MQSELQKDTKTGTVRGKAAERGRTGLAKRGRITLSRVPYFCLGEEDVHGKAGTIGKETRTLKMLMYITLGPPHKDLISFL